MRASSMNRLPDGYAFGLLKFLVVVAMAPSLLGGAFEAHGGGGAPAPVENFIPNGSFEKTTNGPTSTALGVPDGFVSLKIHDGIIDQGVVAGGRFGVDETDAVDGVRSLKYSIPQGTEDDVVRISMPSVYTAGDATHTLSVYAKADRDGLPLTVIYAGTRSSANLSSSWRRYVFTLKTPRRGADRVFVDFGDVNSIRKGFSVWLDALQLEAGGAASSYVEGNFLRGYSDSAKFDAIAASEGQAAYATCPPRIDGKIDDAIWAKAEKLTGFSLVNTRRKACEATEAYALSDNDNLYIAVQCDDSNPGGIVAGDKDNLSFADDLIEMFIDPAHDGQTYYHLAVNSLGAQYQERLNHDTSWNGKWEVAAARNPKGWSAEFVIPLAEFGISPDRNGAIGLNVCRVQRRLKEYSSWSRVRGGFHEPWHFGSLRLPENVCPHGGRVAEEAVTEPFRLPKGFVKDSKAFFPMGLYAAPSGAFADIEEAGFNSMILYESYYQDRVKKEWDAAKLAKWLDEAQKSGVSVMVSLSSLVRKGSLRDMEAIIAKFKMHPALLGYYLADEPQGDDMASSVRKANIFVKQLDPAKPTMIVLSKSGELQRFKDTADIISMDPYPIPLSPPDDVAREILFYRDFTRCSVPLCATLQSFGGGESWFREPTPQEARCMAYLALAHGSRGIYWFRYKPMYSPLWDELKKLNKEISSMSEFLLADVPVVSGRCQDAPSVHYALRKLNDVTFIIAVNASPTPCQASFSVNSSARFAEEYFERRNPAVKDGMLTDHFGSLATHCYILRNAEKGLKK